MPHPDPDDDRRNSATYMQAVAVIKPWSCRLNPNKSTMIRQISGWTLIILGVAGLFLPVLQGWLFIGAGALLLAPHIRMFHRLAAWIHLRFPFLPRFVLVLAYQTPVVLVNAGGDTRRPRLRVLHSANFARRFLRLAAVLGVPATAKT